MSIPLSVCVGDTHYTRLVEDLTFRKNLHGTAEIGLQLSQRLTAQFPAYETVHLFDGPDIIADGRLEDPGRAAGDDGEQWEMSAVGEQARTRDRSDPLIYVDTDLSRWLREQNLRATSGEASATNVPSDDKTDGLVMQYNPGQPIDANSAIVMVYRAIEDAGMLLGSIEYTVVAGFDTVASNYEARVFTEQNPPGTASQVRADPFSVSPASRFATLGGSSPLPTGTTAVQLINKRTGAATTVGSDDAWVAFYGIAVKAARYLLDGSLLTTQADYLRGAYPHEVVTDLLVRMLSDAFDVPNADIDTSSTHGIDQLAYPDGITAEQLLADLMELVPDYYWQVGPADPATGKPSFTWRQWPTHTRYQVSMKDGINLPGADAERYNRVSVRWTDSRGRVMVSRYNAGTTISGTAVPAVPELDDQGLVREPEIQNLGDEIGSQAAADKFGAEFLLAHGTPPVSGTLSIARKVWDNDLGRLVNPWEIEPGHLIRVRELAESADDLAENGRDGKSVFRIVGMAYTASENSTELELDAPPRTDEVLLAEQVSKRERKR